MFRENNLMNSILRIAIGIMIFAVVFLVGGAEAATNISSCTDITTPGEYVLNSSIINYADNTCINIISSKVVFDGNGYTIDGRDLKGSQGVRIDDSFGSLSDIIVRNLTVTDWESGIYVRNSSNNIIINNTAISNRVGIYQDSSSNNTLKGNKALNNMNGIYISSSSNITLSENDASSNLNFGIFLSSSNNNTINDNDASSNSDGIFLTSSDDNIVTRNTVYSNFARPNSGVHLELSNRNKIIGNDISYNDDGIFLSSSSNNNLSNNIVNSNNNNGILFQGDSNILSNNIVNMNNGDGIYVEWNSTNSYLSNNIINSNNGYGIYFYWLASNNTLIGNNVLNNSNGIFLPEDSNILISNNASNNQYNGIELEGDNNTLIKNIASSNNGIGISLSTSNNNDFIDIIALNNSEWDFHSTWDSINNSVVNLTIDQMTVISFNGKDVALKSALSPANDPSGHFNISKFINVTNTSLDSWLFLNVSYNNSDVAGVNIDSLRMWEFNGSSWSQVTGTNGVDTVQKYVYANISSFSIFAPMGVEGVPPASITDLQNLSGTNEIFWTWTDPKDNDFAGVMVFIDGIFMTDVKSGTELYRARFLYQDTLYTISTRTVDFNGNVNQTWVNQTARTTLLGTPIVINITSPENNSTNNTGNITVKVTLDRPGNATLNWDGINETMDGTGRNHSSNKTGLFSGTFSFKVYANDSSGRSNVSETRVVTIDRKIIFNISIDPFTGNTSADAIKTAPSGNTMVLIHKGTNFSFFDSKGNPVDCVSKNNLINISIDSVEKLPSYVTDLGNYKLADKNFSVEPICDPFIPDVQTRIIPDAQIQFNYTDPQFAGGAVRFFSNLTGSWQYLPAANIKPHPDANFSMANTSHFTFFVLAVPALSSINGGESTSGGGESTGGQGVISKEPISNIERVETRSNNIVQNVSTLYKFNPQKYGIYEIVIIGNKNQNNIPIRVELLKGLSKLVKDPAPEIPNFYLNVWGPEDIQQSIFRFRVENSWMASNNITNVKMLKWDGTKWIGLEMKDIQKDDTYSYFEAKSNGLSHLVAVGVKAEVLQGAQEQAPATPTIPSTVTSKTVTGNEPFKTNLNYILVVLAIVIFIAAIFMISARTVKSPSIQEFIKKSPEQYGEKYQEHLLDQYKLYVEMADKISERRQSATNRFLIFNSILISVFGILSGIESMAKQHLWQYLIPFAGLLVSITWATLISSSRHLQSIKLASIQKLESELPAALFNSEWKNSGEGKTGQFVFFSYMERFVPWIFTVIYILLIVITLWNL